MAHGTQQASWDSPKFTIDCMLANASRQLQADGRVLKLSEAGCKLTTPEHMTAGDFVKVRLWLEGEDGFVDIKLAEVRKIHKHWVAVDVIRVSPSDRMRLKRFIDPPAAMPIEVPALIDLLIRV